MNNPAEMATALPTKRQLLLPYAAPYLAYVGIASGPATVLPQEANYLLRMAAVAFGLLMAWLRVRRKDLLACITAHAVTNIALAGFVYSTTSWQFW